MAKRNSFRSLFKWDDEVHARQCLIWRESLFLVGVTALMLFLFLFPWPHHFQISEELLLWENALDGGSKETEWRQVELDFIYRDSVFGKDKFTHQDIKSFSIEGVESSLDGDVFINPAVSAQGPFHTRISLYHFVVGAGKMDMEYLGELQFSDDFSKFAIFLFKDIDKNPTDKHHYYTLDKIITYPAKNREEAVEFTRQITREWGDWPDSVWE